MADLFRTLQSIDELTHNAVNQGFQDISHLESLVVDYLKTSQGLPGLGEREIKRAQRIMGRAIITHAYHRSPVYRDLISHSDIKSPDCVERVSGKFAVTKDKLRDTKNWYVDGDGTFGWFTNATSGSTGDPFPYRLWSQGYWIIEKDHHYKMILQEMSVRKNMKSLLVSRSNLPGAQYHLEKWDGMDVKVARDNELKNAILRLHARHGDDDADATAIVFGKRHLTNAEEFLKSFVDYIQTNKINVLQATGLFCEILTSYFIKNGYDSDYSLDLISNTGTQVNKESLEFLKEIGFCRAYCDHMRSWDGGVSFFTCREGNYHVQEDLASITCINGELGSIDFTSYPAPFVNYVNGDQCTIQDQYELCGCGRWYRPFHFDNGRARALVNGEGDLTDSETIVKRVMSKYHVPFYTIQDGLVSIEDTGLPSEVKGSIVEDLSQLYMMGHFFTNKLLYEHGRREVLNSIDTNPNNPCRTCSEIANDTTGAAGILCGNGICSSPNACGNRCEKSQCCMYVYTCDAWQGDWSGGYCAGNWTSCGYSCVDIPTSFM